MDCDMENIYAKVSIDIGKLKLDASDAIDLADGPIAVLERDKPVVYLIPAAEWEAICERLEDIDLAELIRARRNESAVSVNLADL
jgi:antitoxin StbD